jgi:hypothetical protein
LQYDFIHIDHIIEKNSRKDILDAFSRFTDNSGRKINARLLTVEMTKYSKGKYIRNDLVYAMREIDRKIEYLEKMKENCIQVKKETNAKCICRGRDIDLGRYSINKKKSNFINREGNIGRKPNKKTDMLIDVKCSIANCDIKKDLNIIGNDDDKYTYDQNNPSCYWLDHLKVKTSSNEHNNIMCKCHANGNSPITYNPSNYLRILKLYKFEDCVNQTEKLLKKRKTKWKDRKYANVIPRSHNRENNFINYIEPSAFPIFKNTNTNGGNFMKRPHSFVEPSKILKMCGNHLPIVISVWYLNNWKSQNKFNALCSLGVLSLLKDVGINCDDTIDHVLKSFLFFPHLVHNSRTLLEICIWHIDRWTEKVENMFETGKKNPRF